MKKIFNILIFFLIVISGYGQQLYRSQIFGPRIPGFNTENFEFLDTITNNQEVFIDSIKIRSDNCVDTFAHTEIYRELVFNFPNDSNYIYREKLKNGNLINSIKYGIWNVYNYNFIGIEESSSCFKTESSIFYFEDNIIFDATGIHIVSMDIDWKQNRIEIGFLYKNKKLLLSIQKKNTLGEYECVISTKTNKITQVSSEYLDEEFALLHSHYYDREIFIDDYK